MSRLAPPTPVEPLVAVARAVTLLRTRIGTGGRDLAAESYSPTELGEYTSMGGYPRSVDVILQKVDLAPPNIRAMLTDVTEGYLKAIYHLQQGSDGRMKTSTSVIEPHLRGYISTVDLTASFLV